MSLLIGLIIAYYLLAFTGAIIQGYQRHGLEKELLRREIINEGKRK